MQPVDAMPKAKASAQRALEIDPDLADAHVSLAYASFTYSWDWPAATKHFDRALAFNRLTVENHTYYPFYLTVGGRSAEAIDVARRALDRNPVSASMSHNLAVQLALSRQPDAAFAECRRTLDLDPNFVVGIRHHGRVPGEQRHVPGGPAAEAKGRRIESGQYDFPCASWSPARESGTAAGGFADPGTARGHFEAALCPRAVVRHCVYRVGRQGPTAFAWLDKACRSARIVSRISSSNRRWTPSAPIPASMSFCAGSDYRDRR